LGLRLRIDPIYIDHHAAPRPSAKVSAQSIAFPTISQPITSAMPPWNDMGGAASVSIIGGGEQGSRHVLP